MSRGYISGSFPQMLMLTAACQPFLRVTDETGGSLKVRRVREIICRSDPYSSSSKTGPHHRRVGQCDRIDLTVFWGSRQVNTHTQEVTTCFENKMFFSAGSSSFGHK